jgi:hypothetical protein
VFLTFHILGNAGVTDLCCAWNPVHAVDGVPFHLGWQPFSFLLKNQNPETIRVKAHPGARVLIGVIRKSAPIGTLPL